MDNEGYANLVERYLQNEEEVIFFSGCIQTSEPMRELVSTLESGYCAFIVAEDVKDKVVSGIEREYLRILEATSYSLAFCGEAVEKSTVVPIINEIMLKKNALELFYKLKAKAFSNAGRLYALCGLYYLDPENYTNILSDFFNGEGEVQIGPELNHIALNELAADFENGYYPCLIIWESTREQLNR